MAQPIHTQGDTRRSADSSPIVTPSGTPPPISFHHHFSQPQGHYTFGETGKLQQFFSAAMEAGSSGEEKRRGSEGSQGYYGRVDYVPRHSIPFFSGLSLSRPQPTSSQSQSIQPTQGAPQQQQQYYPVAQSIAMAKTHSGSSDTSSTQDGSRPDPKRAATLPVTGAAVATAAAGSTRRHYDPCREPKLLHFM